MMLKLLPVFLFIAIGFAAEDETMVVWNTHKDALYKSCKAYVGEFSNDKQWKKWNENITERLETRSLETVALDWFADNRIDLEEQRPSAIVQACFFFIKFVETDTAPPVQVRSNITEYNMQQLQQYLNDRVNVARKEMKK